MFDIWKSEELLFGKIVDQLKDLPNFKDFNLSNGLQTFIEANEENRSVILSTAPPTANTILNRWLEQADLLRHCGLNESLDFFDDRASLALVEESKIVLESKFPSIFRSMDKPKHLYDLIKKTINIRRIFKQTNLPTAWIPKVLLQTSKLPELKISTQADFQTIAPKVLAQAVLVKELIQSGCKKDSVLNQLKKLPAGGNLILVIDEENLPNNPDGFVFTSSPDKKVIKIINCGVILKIKGDKPIEIVKPEILVPPIHYFFSAPEYKAAYAITIKNNFNWQNAPYSLKQLAWSVATNLTETNKTTFSNALTVLEVDTNVSNNVGSSNEKPRQEDVEMIVFSNPSLPVETNTISPLDNLNNSFNNLPSEYQALKLDFERSLSRAKAGESTLSFRLEIESFLKKIVKFNNADPKNKTFFTNLQSFCNLKGIYLIIDPPSLSGDQLLSEFKNPDYVILQRFSDSVPEGQLTPVQFGIKENSKLINPAIYHLSVGQYPQAFKDMLNSLSIYTSDFSGQFYDKLENFALNKTGLALASTDFYQFVYRDEYRSFFESNPELSKSFIDKLEIYLRKNFQIKTFDPRMVKDLPDNFIETKQGSAAVHGRIRRLIRPGLVDENNRLRMSALVERD